MKGAGGRSAPQGEARATTFFLLAPNLMPAKQRPTVPHRYELSWRVSTVPVEPVAVHLSPLGQCCPTQPTGRAHLLHHFQGPYHSQVQLCELICNRRRQRPMVTRVEVAEQGPELDIQAWNPVALPRLCQPLCSSSL